VDNGPSWHTPKTLELGRWPTHRHCQSPAIPSWSAAWTTTACSTACLFRRELLNTQTDRRCGVFVLNRRLSAGFYSIRFGYLPFGIGCAEVNAYDTYTAYCLDILIN